MLLKTIPAFLTSTFNVSDHIVTQVQTLNSNNVIFANSMQSASIVIHGIMYIIHYSNYIFS